MKYAYANKTTKVATTEGGLIDIVMVKTSGFCLAITDEDQTFYFGYRDESCKLFRVLKSDVELNPFKPLNRKICIPNSGEGNKGTGSGKDDENKEGGGTGWLDGDGGKLPFGIPLWAIGLIVFVIIK
jgi:hypothetical protein